MAVPYLVGTMIELPRAALLADQIAAVRRLSLVRDQRPDADDAGDEPGRRGALPAGLRAATGSCPMTRSPSLDVEGVGQLIAAGHELGRRTRPDLKVGVCGEHGGDPDSIAFFAKAGLDYVSVLALPGADRPPRRRPRRPGQASARGEAPSRATARDQWTLCYTASTGEGEACRLIPDPRGMDRNTER